ncbi:hypothetical protein N0V91_001711 [Didymella pomorum]|uniref:Uncharacterized protein n=1 Tax=Didymella pomorum TaxID=749634 RepID=A0A9W8ZLI4_9PLEO|nr:hypothetical protein N0V91_001711 [Didymella pomorum]
MCQYWKKLHTCNHPSDRPYIELCRPGFLSNTVCHDIAEDSNLRPSHFPCWTCIKAMDRQDAEDRRRLEQIKVTAAETAHRAAVRARREAEQKAREERVRHEAREKAERERAVETKIKAEREKEAERACKEGGAWMLAEAGGGTKKKRSSVPESPKSPESPFAVTDTIVTGGKKDVWKENGSGGGKDKSEASGRAGVWGPKRILSRKEGAGVLANRRDSSVSGNGLKD